MKKEGSKSPGFQEKRRMKETPCWKKSLTMMGFPPKKNISLPK